MQNLYTPAEMQYKEMQTSRGNAKKFIRNYVVIPCNICRFNETTLRSR